MFKEGYEPAFLSDSLILNPFNHVSLVYIESGASSQGRIVVEQH